MFNKKILIITIIIAILDGIFLYMNRSLFINQIIQVQAAPIKVDYFSAILCYILLIYGLYYFIIKDNKPVYDAFLLGIIVYGIYETTTKSLLKDWNYNTVIIDTLWGGVLFGLTTYITYHITGNNKYDFSVINPASI
jgi:uncharacterized membrane protein